MFTRTIVSMSLALLSCGVAVQMRAADAASSGASATTATTYDASLAAKVQADEHGMRHYVMVILKTGPKKTPPGPERDAMFKGHFANIQRLASEGKLALAGPFEDKNEWRGMFIFAVEDIDAAKQLVDTDPVVMNGEMVPEFHRYYGSAALMLVNEFHQKVQKQGF
jgi:uncharacterized protein YciI